MFTKYFNYLIVKSPRTLAAAIVERVLLIAELDGRLYSFYGTKMRHYLSQNIIILERQKRYTYFKLLQYFILAITILENCVFKATEKQRQKSQISVNDNENIRRLVNTWVSYSFLFLCIAYPLHACHMHAQE